MDWEQWELNDDDGGTSDDADDGTGATPYMDNIVMARGINKHLMVSAYNFYHFPLFWIE